MRRIARQRLVDHRSQRVDVTPGIHFAITSRLLRAHVMRSTQRETRLRQSRPSRLPHGQRDPEVSDQRLPGLEQDVLGLDVAMHDVVLVRILQRRRHRLADLHRLVDAKLFFPI